MNFLGQLLLFSTRKYFGLEIIFYLLPTDSPSMDSEGVGLLDLEARTADGLALLSLFPLYYYLVYLSQSSAML